MRRADFDYVKILEENSILEDGVRILNIPKSQNKPHLKRCGKTRGLCDYANKIDSSIKRMFDVNLGIVGGMIFLYGVKNQNAVNIGFGFLIATPLIQRVFNSTLKNSSPIYNNGLNQIYSNGSFLENLQDSSRQVELEKLASEGNFWKEV